MKYYNGELKTQDRMQDEPWYSDWQTLNHMAWGDDEPAITKWISDFNFDYKKCFKKEYSNQDQLIRWANTIAERKH